MLRDVNSRGTSHWGQFGILLGLTGAGIIVGTLVSATVWMMMTGHQMPTNPDEILQPKYYTVDMVMQTVSTFFIFFLPIYVFARICYYDSNKFIGFNLRISYKQVLLVLAILIASFFLSSALSELNRVLPIPMSWKAHFKHMESDREAQESALIQISSLSKYIFSLLVIALLPALFEETFFRAGMQNLLTRWMKHPWTAIILTSIIFSLIHLSYYGFLVRFALGILLGLVYYYSGSLWLNVLFHFLFNGIQVTALYLSNSKKEMSKADIDTGFPWWLGIFALGLIIYLVIEFIKVSKAQQAKYPPEETLGEDNWLGDIS
jgi:uncharacterized protein